MQLNNLSNHRQLIQVKGELTWCYQQCEKLITGWTLPYFWLGDCPAKITATSYKQILGQEISLLIINAFHQFDANLFAASEGTLRGGGTLILISPNEIHNKDHFYTYIEKQFSRFSFIRIQKGNELPTIQSPATSKPLQLKQQHGAIDAIIKTVTGHRRRPLVLTANRGRGKSAALGIAAKQLVESGTKKILICAPNKNATNTLFKHAGESENITFIAPDLLIQTKPRCDLLMIDEAAGLPVPLLETLTRHYSRLVFATTLHGYEGSGRGFALRFQKSLKQIAPQYRSLHLDQPIRWAINDPLEQFTLQHLCLTESQQGSPNFDIKQDIEFKSVNVGELINDHRLLTELFSLLVTAHYQTKPSDLAQLFNDQHLSILLLMQNKQVLAVALINHEGDIDPSLAAQIYHGKRRLKGHLVAQSLTFHCVQPDAATHTYARIQRIATHPAIQQQGLGKLFIDKITQWAKAEQFDHLCASFGATNELLKFWQDKQFSTLRIGCTKDKCSGTHSFIVNLPLSERAKVLHQEIQKQFHLQLTTQIMRHLHTLDTALISQLLLELHKSGYSQPVIKSYCNGDLPYQFAEFQLIELVVRSDLSTLDKQQQARVRSKVLQNRDWAEFGERCDYTGKKQAQLALRSSIIQLASFS